MMLQFLFLLQVTKIEVLELILLPPFRLLNVFVFFLLVSYIRHFSQYFYIYLPSSSNMIPQYSELQYYIWRKGVNELLNGL